MTRIERSNDAASQWRAARQLYPVYAEMMRQFGLGLDLCRDLENPADLSQPEVLERVWKWFDEVDQSVPVYQLRQFLHSSALATEQNLHLLIDRHLGKPAHSDSDRDKVDFLLVQYYAHCVSPELNEREAEFAGVAEVLKPVLGEVSGPAPDELRPLQLALQVLGWRRSLSEMLQNGALEHGRRIKSSIGEKYFEPASLVEFVRFNFFLRRAFFRLLQSDLHAIRRALDELEKKGHSIVDCGSAGLSPESSLAALRQKCLDWKKPFLASYSGRLPFEEIVAVRQAVENALTQPPLQPRPKPVVMEAHPAPQPVSEAPAITALNIDLPASMPLAPEPELPAAMRAPRARPLTPASAPPLAVSDVPSASIELPGTIPQAEEAPARPPAKKAPAAVAKPVPAAALPVAAKPSAPPKPVAPARQASAANGHAPTQSAAPQPADVQGCLESIAEQLFALTGRKAGGTANVSVGESRVVLSSWEVEAFVRGGDEVSDALQRAVAARALLFGAVENCKRGGDSQALPAIISLAQTEAAHAQQQMEGARKARNLDGAVNLAATSKRLLALIAEAEGLAAIPSSAEKTR